MSPLLGGWSIVESDDEIRCPAAGCGKILRGRLVAGLRGGKTWCWKLPDGTRCCSRPCAQRISEASEITEMDAEMKFDRWMAGQE